MARPRGSLGNASRDLEDDFVGAPAEEAKGGPPPRWPPKPKKVTSNTFHSKVSGGSANRRADRASHFRRGGWVKGYAAGGATGTTDDIASEALKDAPAKKSDAVSNFKRGGRLTAKQRQSMPSSEFALPGKGKGPKGAGAGSYPIPDEGHAKSALSRVEQHGSSGEQATVRRKVKAKFPGMNVKG